MHKSPLGATKLRKKQKTKKNPKQNFEREAWDLRDLRFLDLLLTLIIYLIYLYLISPPIHTISFICIKRFGRQGWFLSVCAVHSSVRIQCGRGF